MDDDGCQGRKEKREGWGGIIERERGRSWGKFAVE